MPEHREPQPYHVVGFVNARIEGTEHHGGADQRAGADHGRDHDQDQARVGVALGPVLEVYRMR